MAERLLRINLEWPTIGKGEDHFWIARAKGDFILHEFPALYVLQCMGIAHSIATGTLIVFLSCKAFGQSTPLTFEATSVTPDKSGGQTGGVRAEAAGLSGTRVTLKQMVLFAHRLQGGQVSGPGWIETEVYDVTANAKGPVTDTELRSMLQTLLEDRFKLKSHRERREIPAYWLVVAKGGPKLRDEKEGAAAFAALTKEGKSLFKPGMAVISKPCDLPEFAERLGRPLDRPVVDKTGIKGRFWCQLEWVPDAATTGGAGDGATLFHVGPSLLTALEEQLGLKLEAQSALVDILVVDHVEKPSEN